MSGISAVTAAPTARFGGVIVLLMGLDLVGFTIVIGGPRLPRLEIPRSCPHLGGNGLQFLAQAPVSRRPGPSAPAASLNLQVSS